MSERDIVSDAERWLIDAREDLHDAAGQIVQELKDEVKRLRAALSRSREQLGDDVNVSSERIEMWIRDLRRDPSRLRSAAEWDLFQQDMREAARALRSREQGEPEWKPVMRKLIAAFYDYQMDQDPEFSSPPFRHQEMMREAEKLLAPATEGTVEHESVTAPSWDVTDATEGEEG